MSDITSPPPAKLLHSFSVEPFGADQAVLADVNNDGIPELILMQSPGQFQSRLYERDDVDDVDRAVYCVTAVTLAGNVLWQDGTPYERSFPYTWHGGSTLVADDFDNDGQSEVAVVRHGRLVVLNGLSGREKNSRELPADNIISLFSAPLSSPEKGRQIIAKNNDKAYAPWDYANPIIVYNADLSFYHEPFTVRGAGHNLVVRDIDADGHHELFIGYCLLDHACQVRWSLDLGPDFDYARDHADHVDVNDVDGNGLLEVCYSGSEDFFVVDLTGQLLWKTRAGHSQRSIVGNWGPDGKRRIIMCEKNLGVWGLNASGEILWRSTDLNGYALAKVRWGYEGSAREWALFRPQLRLITSTPYENDPSWSRSLWPGLLDGNGNFHSVFPWRDEYAHPRQHIRAQRSYDCGIRYNILAADIDKDGLDEIIVHNRHRVWIFKSSAI